MRWGWNLKKDVRKCLGQQYDRRLWRVTSQMFGSTIRQKTVKGYFPNVWVNNTTEDCEGLLPKCLGQQYDRRLWRVTSQMFGSTIRQKSVKGYFPNVWVNNTTEDCEGLYFPNVWVNNTTEDCEGLLPNCLGQQYDRRLWRVTSQLFGSTIRQKTVKGYFPIVWVNNTTEDCCEKNIDRCKSPIFNNMRHSYREGNDKGILQSNRGCYQWRISGEGGFGNGHFDFDFFSYATW